MTIAVQIFTSLQIQDAIKVTTETTTRLFPEASVLVQEAFGMGANMQVSPAVLHSLNCGLTRHIRIKEGNSNIQRRLVRMLIVVREHPFLPIASKDCLAAFMDGKRNG